MAPAPEFGRVERPEEINLEPFDFTLIGYRTIDDEGHELASPEEAKYTFTASGVRPFYNQVDMVRAAAANSGVLAAQAIADFVELSLIDDDERTRWRETLATPGIYFEAEVLNSISNWLAETYTGRPIQPRSVRRSSRSTAGGSSRGAASGRAGARASGRVTPAKR